MNSQSVESCGKLSAGELLLRLQLCFKQALEFTRVHKHCTYVYPCVGRIETLCLIQEYSYTIYYTPRLNSTSYMKNHGTSPSHMLVFLRA